MKIHERHFVMKEAESAIGKALSDSIKKYHLSYGEIFQILGTLMRTWSDFLVREERNGDIRDA